MRSGTVVIPTAMMKSQIKKEFRLFITIRLSLKIIQIVVLIMEVEVARSKGEKAAKHSHDRDSHARGP